jgi:hypothetical protein
MTKNDYVLAVLEIQSKILDLRLATNPAEAQDDEDLERMLSISFAILRKF